MIEREPDVALSTSFGNAGVIAPGYVTPWAAPGMPTKILKYLFKPASPLIFRPTFDPAQWRWIARWLRECDLERFRVNKQRMQRIAYYSRDCLHEFRGRHPFDYGRSQGYLQLFRSEYDVELAQPALAVLRDAGIALAPPPTMLLRPATFGSLARPGKNAYQFICIATSPDLNASSPSCM